MVDIQSISKNDVVAEIKATVERLAVLIGQAEKIGVTVTFGVHLGEDKKYHGEVVATVKIL